MVRAMRPEIDPREILPCTKGGGQSKQTKFDGFRISKHEKDKVLVLSFPRMLDRVQSTRFCNPFRERTKEEKLTRRFANFVRPARNF